MPISYIRTASWSQHGERWKAIEEVKTGPSFYPSSHCERSRRSLIQKFNSARSFPSTSNTNMGDREPRCKYLVGGSAKSSVHSRSIPVIQASPAPSSWLSGTTNTVTVQYRHGTGGIEAGTSAESRCLSSISPSSLIGFIGFSAMVGDGKR